MKSLHLGLLALVFLCFLAVAGDTKCKDVYANSSCHNGGCGLGYQWAELCQMECILLNGDIDLISCKMESGEPGGNTVPTSQGS